MEKHNFKESAPEIGIGVAETDALKFPTSFIRLKTYNLISRADLIYIAGRKGSGKSAICIEYENASDTKYSAVLALKKEALDYIQYRKVRARLIEKQVEEGELTYISREAWSLAIRLNLMIEICLSNKFSIDGRITTLRNYLNNNQWYDFGTMKRMMAFVSDIITRFTGDDSVEVVSGAITSYMDTDPETSEAMKALMSWLDDLKKPILFLIDDIDSQLAVPKTEIERLNAVAYCDALVAATQDLAYPFLSENFHLKVFVPQDLFGQVDQRHMDKTPGAKVVVRWTTTQLLQLLVARLHVNLPPHLQKKWNVDDHVDQIWTYFMPEKVHVSDTRLRRPHPFDSHKVLQSYTLQRPRDLVQLCDKIFRKAYENDYENIDERLIWDSIEEYSDELVSNIVKEYSTVKVNIGEVISSFANFSRHYPKERLVQHLVGLSQISSPEEANQWIDILFDAGFLGVVRDLEDQSAILGRPDSVEEYYFDRDRVRAHEADRFSIHRAFGKSLNLIMQAGVR